MTATTGAPEPGKASDGEAAQPVRAKVDARGRAVGRSRTYTHPGRSRQLRLRLTTEEHTLLTEAAQYAGLTPTGYAANAALAAARGIEAPSVAPVRAALLELMAARTQVRRYGVNVNQAVRELNSTGAAPEWLHTAVVLTDATISRLDDAASALARTARGQSSRTIPDEQGLRRHHSPSAPGED